MNDTQSKTKQKAKAKDEAAEVRRLVEKHGITSAAARQVLAGKQIVGVDEGTSDEDQ